MNMKPFSRRTWNLFACLLPVFCSFSARAADCAPGDLPTGFYLLHGVCDEESGVHLLPLVKTTPPDVVDYVNRISKVAADNVAMIERMEDRDPSLKLDRNPLPKFEQKVRAAIRADKEHTLLFGTSGPAFVRALLLAQIEGSNYISFMAKVLAEEDPQQSRSLMKISVQWRKLREEGIRLLAGR